MSGVRFQGLDYTAVWTVINGQKVKKPRRIFRQIQSLESGALREING
jgi:hypothetical protein